MVGRVLGVGVVGHACVYYPTSLILRGSPVPSAAAAAYPSCLESRTSWHMAQDAGAIGLKSLICGTVSAQSIHEFSYQPPHAGHGYELKSRPTVSHFNVTGAS